MAGEASCTEADLAKLLDYAPESGSEKLIVRSSGQIRKGLDRVAEHIE